MHCAMRDLSGHHRLVRRLAYKHDNEFMASSSSIADGCALKYGILRRETDVWMTGSSEGKVTKAPCIPSARGKGAW